VLGNFLHLVLDENTVSGSLLRFQRNKIR
jgi:hypothetical protein